MANTKINTDVVEDNAITTSKIANDAITNDKIAANSVNAEQLNVSGNGSNSQFLRSDGDGSFTWGTPVGYTGPKLDIFTSSGTWIVPNGVTSCKVFVIGGGGGGQIGYAGTNGKQGGWVQAYVTGLSSGSNITITVGNGGAFQNGTGGASSFGSYATGSGGGGRSGTVGIGSTGSGATLLTRGINSGTSSSSNGFPDFINATWRNGTRDGTYGAGTNTSPLTWNLTTNVYPGSGGASQNNSNGSGTYAGVNGVVVIMH